MPGYKHPCRYCDELIDADSNVCPACGKVNPLGPPRCPKCHNPIQKGWVRCSDCGLTLRTACPHCGQETFFGDYCDQCGEQLVVVCKRCKTTQPPLGPKCAKCGEDLK
jgi:predicted amidophosphoribosyltransferase